MTMKNILTVLVAISLPAFYALAAETNPVVITLPKVFLADPQVLADAKAKFIAGDAALKPAFAKLFKDADQAMRAKPESVTDKTNTPPSGDKHDYMTIAPYYWPNPKTTNGLPYIRRDGEHNPDNKVDSDETRFVRTSTQVQSLALAFYFTRDEKYAAKAAEKLRGFFLNPATRMNANLNYGQAIRGVNDGRGGGLIETHSMARLLDALQLLAQSKSWPAAEQRAMDDWLEKYFTWFTTSKNGRDESTAKNNHGNFYDTQLISLALHLGKTNVALAALEEVKTKRIARQIEPDGRQPLELARTKSLGYSSFSLHALIDLADLGKNSGVDLWHFSTADGRSIQKALEYLLPYADPKKKWPHQQIAEFKRSDFGELLLRAAAEFPAAKFVAALKYFPADELASSRARLLFKTAKLN